jgi:hypothetical protein
LIYLKLYSFILYSLIMSDSDTCSDSNGSRSRGRKKIRQARKRTRTPERRKFFPISRSMRAGLQFPVGRIDRKLRLRMKDLNLKRLSDGAPIYLAATLEYLVAEILEFAGNDAKDRNKGRWKYIVTEENIQRGVKGDEELCKLCDDQNISLEYKEESEEVESPKVAEMIQELPKDFKSKVTITDQDLE